MRYLFFVFCFLNFSFLFSQEEEEYSLPVDSLFREDQFYVSVSYNLLRNSPTSYSQYSFSSGITLGFLRDMPISKNRNWAIGAGLGYSYSDIKHNLKVIPSSPNEYSIDNSYDRSKLRLHYVELPLEIRWRNVTYTSHKFWRVYTGFKLSYLFSSSSIFESNANDYKLKNNNDLNKLQYGPYLSLGYNTVNMYAYYGLNSHFKDSKIGDEKLEMNSFNVGFIFYIL